MPKKVTRRAARGGRLAAKITDKSSAVARSQTNGKQFFSGKAFNAACRATSTIATLTSDGV